MAAKSNLTLKEAVKQEVRYVNVPVKLSAKDLKQLRRIFDGKYEPLEDGWLVVRVKEKPCTT
jgi:hypothetical protein